MAVAFDEEAGGDLDLAGLGDAADIVAPQIDQHQMLGPLLGVAHQFFGKRLVFLRRLAARPCAGDGADGHDAVAQPHQDFRARSHNGKTGKGEVVQERRRVQPAQRAIEGERRQGEGTAEALARHHLEHVAGADVLLGALDDGEILVMRRVGFDGAEGGKIFRHRRRSRGRALQIVDRIVQPLGGAGIRRPCIDAVLRPHRRHDQDLVAHRVEDRDDRRPQQDRVGQAERIGRNIGQLFDEPHHVVAEIAEQPGRHRRQAGRQRHAAFADQCPQRRDRRRAVGCEGVGVRPRVAVDLGFAVQAAPDQIGLEPDDRIASARLAALDALEQERVVTALAEFEERRDRRLQIGDALGIEDLRLA